MRAVPAKRREQVAQPQEKSYRVIGQHNVSGQPPGSIVRLTLTESQEKTLTGFIEPVVEDVPPAPVPAAKKPEPRGTKKRNKGVKKRG